MPTIIFIRHGPTRENHDRRIQGQQPGTLLIRETEGYLAAITPLLRNYNPSLLISSDLKRALGTRQMLKAFLQQEKIAELTLPSLRERAMGSLEGRLWSQVITLPQTEPESISLDFRPYGGENDEDVRQRVSYTLHYFAEHLEEKTVACISHAGWLKQFLQLIKGEGLLAQGWVKRTAIYECQLTSGAFVTSFKAIPIKASLSASEEDWGSGSHRK